MPTKTKKRSTNSKKKASLLSRINFSSRKTQFITVILLVAVLGGGWFTYKSFAAEPASTSNVPNGLLFCKARSTACSQPKETKKNGIPVIELGFSGRATSFNDFQQTPSQWLEVCFYASSPGSVAEVTITDRKTRGILAANKRYNVVGDYKWYCMERVKASGSLDGVLVEIANPIASGNSVRVSNVQVKSVPAPITTSASPTK